MRLALNRVGSATAAADAFGDGYRCPLCGAELIVRHGRILRPHFAHRSGSACQWRAPRIGRARHGVLDSQLDLFGDVSDEAPGRLRPLTRLRAWWARRRN